LDKIVVTSLLIIAGVVAAVVLYNAVYPAIAESSDALTRRQRQIDDRLQSQVEIVHATIPYGVITEEAWVWVKNVGSQRISAIENCDIFFGPEGNFASLSYGAEEGGWEYEIEQGTEWDPTRTLKITISNHDGDPLDVGTRYFVKVTTPNGVSDEYYFSR